MRAADAKLANAKTEFDRYARLVKSSAVSRAEYELAETAYRVAQEDQKAALQSVEKGSIARKEDIDAQEAQVTTIEARLAEANLQLRDSTLRAPYNGVVAQRFVEENQTIVANKPVVTFQNIDEIDIVADVPEAAMAADIRSPAIVRMVAEFSTAPGMQFPVRIKEVAQVADPATQTFQVRVAMKAPRNVLVLPGMTATVTATYRRPGTLGRRILVPISAVYKEDTGDQVAWVIGPNQMVSRRLVKMGAATGGQVEIVDGLRPGDRIVVAGAPFLSEGMKVRDLGDALGGGSAMNLGELSVRKNRVVFVLMFLVLLGGLVAYHKLGRLEDPEFTHQGSADHHSLPGGQCRGGGQGGHQPDRKRLPATGPTQTRRVGVYTRTIGGYGCHPGSIQQKQNPPGLGRTSPQNRRRAISIATLGSRQVAGGRRFRRRLRRLSGHYR